MINKITKEAVYVCIGSANVALDSFGPRLGSLLESYGLTVYGTMENPVNGLNCSELIPQIKERHQDEFIIAVDACIFKKRENEGKLLVKKRPIHPAAGLGRELPPIGDMSIIWCAIHEEEKELIKTSRDTALAMRAAIKALNKIIKNIEKNEN